jgi:hypothetical protein
MSSGLSDIITELTPSRATMAAFEKGGPACAKTIERTYQVLRTVELEFDEDEISDLEWMLEQAEERIAEQDAKIAKLEERLREHGLLKEPVT